MAFSSEANSSLLPSDAVVTGDCGILIPALNEEASIAKVIKVALESKLGPVLVIDDGSSDNTTNVALAAGATVLKMKQNLGKGGAVYVGAETLKTDTLVLLDADLTGLSTKHIRDLAKPVLESTVMMTRGVFAGGRLATTVAQNLAPYLNGQRAIKRDKLLSLKEIKSSGYGIEVLITQAALRQKWSVKDIPLHNVSQIMKEEKRGFWQGARYRFQAYGQIINVWFKNSLKPK